MKKIEEIKINGGSHRYLSELPEFADGLPKGVVIKSLTDVGGSFVAENCDSNYIIVCPFRDLVESICADKNSKHPIIPLMGGISKSQFLEAYNKQNVKKIAVTYDSFYKIAEWTKNTDFKVLVDEYHTLLDVMDYREEAINSLLEELKKYEHITWLSATPLNYDFEPEFLSSLQHYVVEWDRKELVKPERIKTYKVYEAVCSIINDVMDGIYTAPNNEGKETKVEELYIFLNSVKGIKQICDTCELEPEDVKIVCADRIRNKLVLGNYKVESVTAPNKKINMFTSKSFQGCNLFTNNGLIVVVSDSKKSSQLIDINTTLPQIVGRCRSNKEFNNCFKKTILHIFSTNKAIESDEEFNDRLNEVDKQSEMLANIYNRANDEEKAALLKELTLEDKTYSIVNGSMKRNELKINAFKYKHYLKNMYKDGYSIMDVLKESKRFEATKQSYRDEYRIKLAKLINVSFKTILDSYYENPTEDYLSEYPEFAGYKQYLTIKEVNSLRYNKEKLDKAVSDKKQIERMILKLHRVGFIPAAKLKEKVAEYYREHNIDATPKASIFEGNRFYDVKKTTKRVNGFTLKGYEFGSIKYSFNNK